MKFTKTWHWVLAYVLADLFCVGMGMGVPIVNILFGFVLGWYWVRRHWQPAAEAGELLAGVLRFGLLTSAFTFLLMLLLWGPAVKWLFDPALDVAEFGHPMILFQPLPSLVGWLVLMVFISPFLQWLTTTFAAALVLQGKLRGRKSV